MLQSLSAQDLADDLRPPTDAEVAAGLSVFADRARAHYGTRLKAIRLFGSRARGDHRPESDADVVVVLADGAWREYDELMKLSDIAFDVLLDHRANIQPWAIPEGCWIEPALFSNPSLVAAMRRDGRELLA